MVRQWWRKRRKKRKHGVGILLHKRLTKRVKRFLVLSPRVAALDVEVTEKLVLRIISAYFPHCGYPDNAVDEMYTQLESLIAEAKAAGYTIIIGADCNAEAGGVQGLCAALGSFGNESSSARGEWLKAWAEKSNLLLANTVFKKRWDKIWTHASTSGRQRQIDYILVERSKRSDVRNAEATVDISAGSDHKAVHMTMMIRRSRKRKWRKPGRVTTSFKDWKADDPLV